MGSFNGFLSAVSTYIGLHRMFFTLKNDENLKVYPTIFRPRFPILSEICRYLQVVFSSERQTKSNWFKVEGPHNNI